MPIDLLPLCSLGNARPKRMYFVVFYGSTADFAWVGETSIIPYHGVEGFTTYAQEAVDKVCRSSLEGDWNAVWYS